MHTFNGHVEPLTLLGSPREESRMLARHIETIGRGRALSILEAGCGNSWTLEIPSVRYSLTGVDLNQDALNLRLAQRGDLDKFILGDLRTVALAENSYDVIYNSFVLEHVHNAELVLDNFRRWLTPGGLLILRIPDPRSVYGALARLTPFWFHVLYKRYIAGCKTAGKPGFDPFPTVYDKVVSRSGIHGWCFAHGLTIREEVGWNYQVGRPGLVSLLVRSFIKTVSLITLGRLAADHVNLTYVIEKPTIENDSQSIAYPVKSECEADESAAPDLPPVRWPPKSDLFGIRVTATNCRDACDAILNAARQRKPAVVSAFSVHALIEATAVAELGEKVNRFAMIAPDGQPVRWALNWLHGARLQSNLRGSDLMWELCRRAANEGVSIYLYGGTCETLEALQSKLRNAFGSLVIAGAAAPPFRQLTDDEDAKEIERMNASGAGLVFIGLGCPKQDYFAADHVDKIRAVQVCVGAAFDFHAGTKPSAPLWMQRRGLEWAFRLYQEPGRLWKRYLVTNTKFILKLLPELARLQFARIARFWQTGNRSKPIQSETASSQVQRSQSLSFEE